MKATNREHRLKQGLARIYLNRCGTFVALIIVLVVNGCKPDDTSVPKTAEIGEPSPTPSTEQLQELHSVIDNAWARLVDGDPTTLSNLLHPDLISERILNEIKPDRELHRDLRNELIKEFPNIRDRFLRILAVWKDSYWNTRTPAFTNAGMDIEIELYHNDVGLNFLHLICTRIENEWVIVDFFADSDATLYSKRAAKIVGSIAAGKTDDGDVHRLRRIQDFLLNNDYKSIRTAFPKLPESIKNDRGTLMIASNAANALEDREWADSIRQRYIRVYGKDATLLILDLDYYSGIGEWKQVSITCQEINLQKKGSGPALYLQAAAESAAGDYEKSAKTAAEGIRVAPDFLGNWLQAIAGYCQLQQYKKATELAMKTMEQFDDVQVSWSNPGFPGLVESKEFQRWQSAQGLDEDDSQSDE